MREGGKTFSWQNLVQLSDANAWDDTCMGCHIGIGIGTQRMVICHSILSCNCSADEDSSEKVKEEIYQG